MFFRNICNPTQFYFFLHPVRSPDLWVSPLAWYSDLSNCVSYLALNKANLVTIYTALSDSLTKLFTCRDWSNKLCSFTIKVSYWRYISKHIWLIYFNFYTFGYNIFTKDCTEIRARWPSNRNMMTSQQFSVRI